MIRQIELLREAIRAEICYLLDTSEEAATHLQLEQKADAKWQEFNDYSLKHTKVRMYEEDKQG